MAFTQIISGGVQGPHATFGDHILFEGVTFRADCTFGEHCTFIGCTFVKWKDCKKCPFNPPSRVGNHGVMKGGSAEWVHFTGDYGVWDGVSDTGDNTRPPSCVDCVGKATNPAVTGVILNATVVNSLGVKTPAQWCMEQAC